MKKVHIAAVGAALIGLLASRQAAALSITLAPVAPVGIGQTQTFRIANVDQAVGQVTYNWNFGDGGTTGPAADTQATHTYQAAGHYTVIVLATDDASRTSASFVQTVSYPLTAKPPSNSSSIIIDAERHQVWTANSDSDSVSVIDADQLVRLREVPVGREPHALAQAPDGTIWVANQKSDEVVVLDRNAGEIKARIAMPYASQPRAVAFGPNGMAYVSLYATGKLVEIDSTSRKVGRDIALGPTPYGVSVAADGRIFVTRFISPADHGEVWVVSPDTMTLKNTIQLAFDKGPDTQSSGRGCPTMCPPRLFLPTEPRPGSPRRRTTCARAAARRPADDRGQFRAPSRMHDRPEDRNRSSGQAAGHR